MQVSAGKESHVSSFPHLAGSVLAHKIFQLQTHMKNIAIILAGGTGHRMGENIPKQFLKIAGKKVIEHTVDVFQRHPRIDEIAIVVHTDYVRDMEDIVLKNHFSKIRKILIGGQERYQSSLAAINAYEEEVNLIFHDSVRPLVNERIINDCLAALEHYNAVDVAVPASDTIIQVNEKSEIIRIPSRSLLRNGQTPQAFKHSTIKMAYEKALSDPHFITTDDCGVVLKYLPEEPIYVVRGEQFNMKLTYKEDLFLLDKLFQLRSVSNHSEQIKSVDAERLKHKIIVVFGGTRGIGEEICKICRECNVEPYVFSRSLGVDVSDKDAVREALKSVYKKEGRIDYVVNTAGILNRQPLTEMDYDTILQSIRINYMGCVIVAKESYQYLKESKGAILFYTSSSYTRGRAIYSLYSSSKAAIVNLVQALCEEWYDTGIRINCINPERTKTPMRIQNFGNEPADSLLDPGVVAIVSLNTLLSNMTGEIVDVKR